MSTLALRHRLALRKNLGLGAALGGAGSPPFINNRAPTVTDDITAGYFDAGCIASIAVATFGSGYTSAPTLTMTTAPGGGRTATAVCYLNSAGQVAGYWITDPGKGYIAAPNVFMAGGGGASAAGKSTLAQPSLWLAPGGKVYQCTDATAGAAVWSLLNTSTLPGDLAPATLMGAYSTVLLCSAYVANKCIDITRLSDLTTLTIGFVSKTINGTSYMVVDAATADAFCAGTTGYVTKAYDQSGLGQDAAMSILLNAPLWTQNTVGGLRCITLASTQNAIPVGAIAIANGGSAYTQLDVGKQVTLVGGTQTVAGTAIIGQVNGGTGTGAVTAVSIGNPGLSSYSAIPANPVATTGGGTTGTGLTLTCNWNFMFLSATVASYVPKNTGVVFVGQTRSSAQTSNVVNMGAASDWNNTSQLGQVVYPQMSTNSSNSATSTPASPSVSIFLAVNAAATMANDNQTSSGTATAGPASATAFSIGNNELTHGPAVSDGVAWLVYSTAPTPAQAQAIRAALLPITNIAPQVNDPWIAFGDSITAGHKSIDLQGYPRQALALIRRPLRMFNMGIVGTTIAARLPNFIQEMNRLYQPTARRNVLSMLIGTNDIPTGATAATIYGNITTYVTNFKALGSNTRVIVGTILPRTGLTGPQQTQLTALNVLIRANTAGADAVCDFAADPVMGDPSAPSNPLLYVDGLHPTDLGYSIMATDIAPYVSQMAA